MLPFSLAPADRDGAVGQVSQALVKHSVRDGKNLADIFKREEKNENANFVKFHVQIEVNSS